MSHKPATYVLPLAMKCHQGNIACAFMTCPAVCSGGDGGGTTGTANVNLGGGGGGTFTAVDTFVINPPAQNTGSADGFITISYAN